MANVYLTLKQEQQTEINNFPMAFAFSKSQFEKEMARLGLAVDDTDKIIGIGGGGFIRRTDREAFDEMLKRLDAEMTAAMSADPTGDGFLFDMFDYELSNHEYIVTLSVEDTLDALGLTPEQVEADPRMKYALDKAVRAQHARYPDGV